MWENPDETVTVFEDTVTNVAFRILELIEMNMDARDYTAKDMYTLSLSLQILWSLG